MSYSVSVQANFHESRTIALSDICKNILGHSMGGGFIMLDSIVLRPNDVKSNEFIEYVIDCIGVTVYRGHVILINNPLQLPLDELSCKLATGTGEWSYLTLKAIKPRKSNEAPISIDIIISARFVLNKTNS